MTSNEQEGSTNVDGFEEGKKEEKGKGAEAEDTKVFKLPMLPGKSVAAKDASIKCDPAEFTECGENDSNTKQRDSSSENSDIEALGVEEQEKTKENVTETEKDSTKHRPSTLTHDIQIKKCTPVPYSEPSWGTRCNDPYYLEVIKNGCVVKNVELRGKSFFIAGRLDDCDIKLEHPSSSRYHAVLQYKGSLDDKKGFYIYDLGSTHGTVVNKVQVKPMKYFRLRVGYVVKFGGSSRMYVLQGPEDYQEVEEPSSEALQAHAIHDTGSDDAVDHGKDRSHDVEKEEDNGIDWGFDEDAMEEETNVDKMIESRPPLELKDPKKTLRGFFEREGLELIYEDEDKGKGNSRIFVIKVRLPIETPTGEDMYAEATASKKKDAVLACAVRACQILDAHGLLRNAEHESVRAKRRKRMEENDFYDSDEDNFLDRTGSVERKRKLRMQKAGRSEEANADSYENLVEKAEDLQEQMNKVITRIEDLRSGAQRQEEDDSLDAYMNQMNAKLARDAIKKAERELAQLEKNKSEVDRLIEICRPPELPPLLPSPAVRSIPSSKERSPRSVEERSNKTVPPPKILTNNSKPALVPGNNGAQSSIKETNSQIMKDVQRDQASDARISEERKTQKPNSSSRMPPPMSQNLKQNKQKKKVYGAPSMQEAMERPEFSDWTPPEGQTGDGITKLNEKFGY